MTNLTKLPTNPKELKCLYNETLKQHQEYLDELEQTFNRRCEEIRVKANQKRDALPESDRAERQKVLEEEKTELDTAVLELKAAIQRSSQDMRRLLESIEACLEANEFNFETQLQTV